MINDMMYSIYTFSSKMFPFYKIENFHNTDVTDTYMVNAILIYPIFILEALRHEGWTEHASSSTNHSSWSFRRKKIHGRP